MIMKIQYYRNKIARILFAVFLMTICSILIADDAVTEAADGIYRRGVASYDYKDYKAAMKQFKKMQKEFPMSKHAIRGWEYIAQCENALGDKYASFEAYQKIWDNHKNFNKLSTITKNQMNIADNFFKLKRYKIAIELYNKILENAPYSDSAASAQYSIAHSLLNREDYYASKEEFIKLIQNYPESQLIDDAAYNLGYVNYLQSTEKEYDQTATTQAIAAFRQFIHQFPSSPNVYNAQKYIQKLRNRKAASLFRTGEYYENIRAPKAANISFREVIDQYPDTDYAMRARNKINKINDSKIAKSVQAQQVVEMVRLENQKELARNRDIASRMEIEQKTDQVETKTGEVSQESAEPAATMVSEVPGSVEQESDTEIDKAYADRIKELYMDPEMREELRSIMKEAYLKETLHDKERKSKWQQQKMVEQVKPVNIDIQQEKVGKIASANINHQPKVNEEVDIAGADTKKEIFIASKPEKADSIPETFQIEEKKGKQSYNNEKNYSSVDTGNEELSVEYKTVDVPSEEIESQVSEENTKEVSEEKEEDRSEFAIDASELNDIIAPQETPEKQEIIQPDIKSVANDKIKEIKEIAEAKKAEEAKKIAEAKESEEAKKIAEAKESEEANKIAEAKKAEEAKKIAEAKEAAEAKKIAEAKKVEDVKEIPEVVSETKNDESRIKKQEDAARLKRMVDYIKKRDEKEKIKTRKLSGIGNVRRAEVKGTGNESKSNALQRQYVPIYYLIISGDSAFQRGVISDAKRFYGKALDGLLDIKSKAPEWKSDIINWRINHCRTQLQKMK